MDLLIQIEMPPRLGASRKVLDAWDAITRARAEYILAHMRVDSMIGILIPSRWRALKAARVKYKAERERYWQLTSDELLLSITK